LILSASDGMIETRNMSSLPRLRLELDGDLSKIRPAATELHKFLQQHGCSEQMRADCELIMVEACNNAVKHSSGWQGHSEPVVVEARIEPREIELRVIDHGPGFNWPEDATLPEPEQESGRGVFLIKALTDYAAYFREADYNILVLRKHRSRPAS
jgi:serine/threonine-protein kinase RsbW